MRNFKGTGVAVVTPFTSAKEVDYPALKKIINNLIDNKVDYLVMLGTTGESVTLTKEEKKKITDTARETIAGRAGFVLGIGGNYTDEILRTIKETDISGIDAILSVSPYYNKPSQKGIYQHYKAISEASPLPIILYNVPSRTMSNISAETTLQLANDCKNIIGVKEASGNFEQCMIIIKNKPSGFMVISGDDIITLPLISLGMDGVISVIANAYPLEFSNMVRTALEGDFKEAARLHYLLFTVMQHIYLEGNPAGIKALLHTKGFCENVLRLPLCPVSEALYGKLKFL